MTTGQNRTKRATQSDVAALAGVSTAVVSAVISSKPGKTIRVGKEAEKRVREAMETLGYAPNVVAQSLAGGKRNIIGVFTYEAIFPSDSENFFYPFLLGIERGAMQLGQDLLLFTSSSFEQGPRSIFPNGANRMGVADGAILLGEEPDKSELKQLYDTGFPFVTIGRRDTKDADLNWVAADYTTAVSDVVDRCASNGHRTLKFVGATKVREQNMDREAGFLNKQGNGLTLSVERLAADDIDANWLQKCLDDGNTVVLTETFKHAVALEQQVLARHGNIPETISIVALAAPLNRSKDVERWTRISVPREEMGELAVRNLISQIRTPGHTAITATLPCGFVPGTTLTKI
ncbi:MULTISPECIES: LacI family DNA-binding transcriptional regulator [Thalassospira]|uniref:LacI family DNA-binding transcriptional regulator n=1 Tax=Thalassospira aquimaris TaxID=3037796 RepID=A0ABT6GCE3_9PROT|nr:MULTISPECIES: LacI family DNA-binding transcriptional regulator [Thalassospira]MDG4719752.1 LacI family DNA-binding transcriptional regulator [Thalassospira sp. FZY0004]